MSSLINSKSFFGIVLFCVTVSDVYSAEIPVVGFDTGMVVSCREVTTPSKTSKYKLIEAVFKISSSVVAGTESDVSGLEYSISDDKEKKSLQVVEFLPKTEMYTDIVDPIVVVETGETGSSGQISANYRTISPKGMVNAEASAKGQSSAKSSVQYKKLAPKTLLVASGTKERRHAVFFKMNPTKQTTLEGERTFSVIFQVPQEWKADWVYVKCEATGVKRGIVAALDTHPACGLAGYSVGLHLEGDDNGRSVAEELAKRQQDLLDELAKTRHAKSWLSITWEWFWFLNKLSPVQGATASNAELQGILKTKPFSEVEQGLPPSVKERLEALNATKTKLEKLSGSR